MPLQVHKWRHLILSKKKKKNCIIIIMHMILGDFGCVHHPHPGPSHKWSVLLNYETANLVLRVTTPQTCSSAVDGSDVSAFFFYSVSTFINCSFYLYELIFFPLCYVFSSLAKSSRRWLGLM